MPPRRRRLVLLAPAAACAALAGCGGSISLGFGFDGGDDPPTVSLVASVAAATPGQSLRLAAAASDDGAVERVQFFRLDADGAAALLGSNFAAPYALDTTMPATSAREVRYFARAIDNAGQRSDSATVSVTVLR